MKITLMTSERTLLEGEAESVSGRAPKGLFEVLDRHGPWVSPVEIGELRVRLGEGETRSFAVHGGLIEVTPGRSPVGPEGADLTPGSVLVLADGAEADDEVDAARAEGARDRAMGRMREQAASVDLDRARRALARSEARLRVSAKR